GVGICGLGTVGSATYNLIRKNAEEISRKTGERIRIVQVACRRDHPDCDLSTVDVTRDIFDVVRNPDVAIVIELIGGTDPALELVKQSIANGKHVVTANKALLALHGDEIFRLANEAGVFVKFEAAIGGGIPVVKAIREGLASNSINWLAGIINGTSNYILSEMEDAGNRSFGEVLEEAKALGYAEADPTFDIEGIDAAHKLTILASVAFGIPLEFDDVYTEGISTITPADIRYAGELGYRIKHLCIARKTPSGVELRVHPTLVEKEQMLSQVHGVMNAVMVGSDAAGSTMYFGAGAGGMPTASAVVADNIDVVRTLDGGGDVANLGFVPEAMAPLPILTMEEITTAFYLKMKVLDKPGVMARISTILSQHNISIEALIQKDARSGEAPIVIITDEILESALNEAISELESLDEVIDRVTHIRVQTF
ncbi:MAG: homoserine dehydrogenase, partial [Pseudomonadales bacterium]|nr:homoserine dehydrogenase [Pseudomonadales bacterium]